MQDVPTSTRPRDAIRNAEILYALEWRSIRVGEEEIWVQRAKQELNALKSFSVEGRLRYEAALQARDHAAIQHINGLRSEIDGWIRRLEQCVRASEERKRQREAPPVIVPPAPPKAATPQVQAPRLEDITSTSIAGMSRMYGIPTSSVEKPVEPAKKISLKPLLVPIFLLALIWWGTTILQQFSRPSPLNNQPTPVPASRASNSTTSKSSTANAAESNATTNFSYRVAEIDASEDAVVNRWLRGDKARRFKALWIYHEYRLNQFWEMNFPRNWAYRTYFPPSDIRLFDKYAAPTTSCVGRSDDLLEIASYCPSDRTIYANAGVMADEFSNRDTAISVLSLAHEWGHHIQELKGSSLTDVQLELQADCFAGVYLAHARMANIFSAKDYSDAKELIKEMGDSYRGKRTHGTPSERYLWLTTGYTKGVSSCMSGIERY